MKSESTTETALESLRAAPDCYICQHVAVCRLKRGLDEVMKRHRDMVDSYDANIYKPLAAACRKFKPEETK